MRERKSKASKPKEKVNSLFGIDVFLCKDSVKICQRQFSVSVDQWEECHWIEVSGAI